MEIKFTKLIYVRLLNQAS